LGSVTSVILFSVGFVLLINSIKKRKYLNVFFRQYKTPPKQIKSTYNFDYYEITDLQITQGKICMKVSKSIRFLPIECLYFSIDPKKTGDPYGCTIRKFCYHVSANDANIQDAPLTITDYNRNDKALWKEFGKYLPRFIEHSNQNE
jgi:hypothetical protein